MRTFFWLLLLLAASSFAVWSFILTDPNLVLMTWSPYWQWQTWLWQTYFPNHVLTTYFFVTIIVLWSVAYGGFLWTSIRERKLPTREFLLLCAALFFSYNALSHDVFNYIFNAKIVAIYQANPHVQVALDFPADVWTRFMHNTHTPAPYGYGWTALSLVPFVAGMGKFLPTWLAFRIMSLVSIGWLWWVWQKRPQTNSFATLVVLFNPLFLIEVMSSAHNDLWMMSPALWAMSLAAQEPISKKIDAKKGLASGLLLLLSISMKFATLTLLPLWGMLFLAPLLKKFKFFPIQWFAQHWTDLAALSIALPLLTARSQQFHPWYLVWVLVWLPWMRWRWLQMLIVAFSFSSLLRYLPWLWTGDFSDSILWQQKLITWGGGLFLWGTALIIQKFFIAERART